MVRNYKRKTDGPKYSNEKLREALAAMRAGKSLNSCSRTYGIPRKTLYCHKNGKVSKPGTLKMGRFSQVMPPEVERELASHVREMSIRFHGMTEVEVRKLAYKLAVEKSIDTGFNHTKEMAGEDWLLSFRQRHDLSLRKPQPTNLSRIIGFNSGCSGCFVMFQLLNGLLI